MAYLFLAVAIILELVATMVLNYSEGFTKFYPTISCVLLYIACFFCLSRALLNLNLSIAYATWCGVGIVVSTLISVFIFKQGITGMGILGIILVVAGCVILNLYGSVH
ncbi:multidrug efflux SMR transporter subunit EbrB [Clostridium baratii]|uniref:DMT family transporter n=1 Tax=Clostridium baratii TaxID=1561 RepID=UPI0005F2EB4D|nr:multidrug efflux SMR transporter [Clostridium baratii]KJU71234.1 hypothetical protein UC77_09715 [Clostridium baratii]